MRTRCHSRVCLVSEVEKLPRPAPRGCRHGSEGRRCPRRGCGPCLRGSNSRHRRARRNTRERREGATEKTPGPRGGGGGRAREALATVGCAFLREARDASLLSTKRAPVCFWVLSPVCVAGLRAVERRRGRAVSQHELHGAPVTLEGSEVQRALHLEIGAVEEHTRSLEQHFEPVHPSRVASS